MSLDHPTYVASLQNNIRARPISWEGAVRSRTITEGELKKIKAIDKVRKEQRRQTIESDITGYRSLLLGDGQSKSIFQSAVKRPDIVQYMLVLTEDLIEDIPGFACAILEHDHPFQPFIPLLKQSAGPEEPVPLLTSSVMARIISKGTPRPQRSQKKIEEALPRLYEYISTLTRSADPGLQDIAVQEYSTLLRDSRARLLFWERRKENVKPLFDILRAAAGSGRDNDSTVRSGPVDAGLAGGVGVQLLYHVLLVIWQLSFEADTVAEGLEAEQEIVLLYTHLLRLSPKEKTSRLILSTLQNLLPAASSTLLPAAMFARLPTVLGNLQGRHLTDADLQEDLQALKDRLEEYARTQTTLDQYAAEVRGGHLRWSPPHRNAAFWRENARQIIELNKAELPRMLAEIMSKRWENDKQVLAIGCNDVACLVREAPEKRSQLEKLGLKTIVMQLMQESDESVRWESLRAVGEWLSYSVD